MAKKADHQDDSTECLRATADDEINHNMDVVDKGTPMTNIDQIFLNLKPSVG
jgi:hypothetical protein